MKIKKLLIITLKSIFFICLLNFFSGGEVMASSNQDKKVLVAYFSRTGEQYSVGNIKEGNTYIVAKMIADKTKADLFEIKVKTDNYPTRYDALTEYAKNEKKQNLRPEIIGNIDNFNDYDVIFVGYPNWWADLPMPVYTFLEKYDFSNKSIAPFCTHEGSGISQTPNKIKTVTKANMLESFDIYGHTAQNDREKTLKEVTKWLTKIGF